MNLFKKCLGAFKGFFQAINFIIGLIIGIALILPFIPFLSLFLGVSIAINFFKKFVSSSSRISLPVKILLFPLILTTSLLLTLSATAIVLALSPLAIPAILLHGIIQGFKKGPTAQIFIPEPDDSQPRPRIEIEMLSREQEALIIYYLIINAYREIMEKENFINNIVKYPEPELLLTAEEISKFKLLLELLKNKNVDVTNLELLLNNYHNLLETQCPFILESCKALLERRSPDNVPKVVFLELKNHNNLDEKKEISTPYHIFNKKDFDTMVRNNYIMGEGLQRVNFPEAKEYQQRFFTGFPQKLFNFIIKVKKLLSLHSKDITQYQDEIMRSKRLERFSNNPNASQHNNPQESKVNVSQNPSASFSSNNPRNQNNAGQSNPNSPNHSNYANYSSLFQ